MSTLQARIPLMRAAENDEGKREEGRHLTHLSNYDMAYLLAVVHNVLGDRVQFQDAYRRLAPKRQAYRA